MIRGPKKMFVAMLSSRGYSLDEVAACVISDDGEFIAVDESHESYPRTPKPTHAPKQIPRPGLELKGLLGWIGFHADEDCGCGGMAVRMDVMGTEWCEGDGMAEILDTMRAEHAKRWADGRTILPWSDLAARQLVKLACRRARAKAAA